MPRGKKAASTTTAPRKQSRKAGRVNGAAGKHSAAPAKKEAAPKKARAAAAPAKDHNITDAVIRDFTWRAIRKKQEHDLALEAAKTVMGEYRSILKSAKKAGLDTKAMTRVILERVREKDDVLRDEQNFIRYATLFDMPMTQADLFDGTYASVVNEVATEEDERQAALDADDAGYRAGLGGFKKSDNPHHQTEASELWAAWSSSWHRGQNQLAKGLSPQTATGARRPSGNPEDHVEA